MEVNVNGEYIELGDSIPAITRKSIDINSPSIRFLDFTNKFQLPYTNTNARILDNPTAIGSNNRALDKTYQVTIEDVFKIFKGKGFLTTTTKDKFSLQVVDSSVDLFKALDVKLNTISWDDLDTILTQSAIDANDTANIDSCWIWGKACYHSAAFVINTDQTTGDARCKYSRPAFFVQGLLKRAIELAGYTFTPSLPNLAISSNHKQFFFTSYQKTLNASFAPSGTVNITNLTVYDFKHADVTATTDSIEMLHRTIIRFRGYVVTDADIELEIHAHNGPHTKETANTFLLPRSGYVDFSSSEMYDSTPGMTAHFRLNGTGNVTFTNVLIYTNLSEDYEDLSSNHWLNFKIKAHDNLPDLTYLDLFRLICVVGNQYHIVNTFKKTFEFGSLATLNKLKSVDWSDKFIQGSETITSQFPGVFQKNWLKYTNDKTVSPELGWSSFVTDNESLVKEGDYIVLKFGASKEATFGSNDVVHVPIYNDTTRIIDQELSIRLFTIDGSTLRFNPISWSLLAQNYYSNWFNSLYRIRVIQADFDLNKLDVLSWTPKQLVYIDYFKTTFIVLEISNFIPGRKTKVKLLGYGR